LANPIVVVVVVAVAFTSNQRMIDGTTNEMYPRLYLSRQLFTKVFVIKVAFKDTQITIEKPQRVWAQHRHRLLCESYEHSW